MNTSLTPQQLTEAFSRMGEDIRIVILMLLDTYFLTLEEINITRIIGAEFAGMFEIPSENILGEYTAELVIIKDEEGKEFEFHNPSISKEGRVERLLTPVVG